MIQLVQFLLDRQKYRFFKEPFFPQSSNSQPENLVVAEPHYQGSTCLIITGTDEFLVRVSRTSICHGQRQSATSPTELSVPIPHAASIPGIIMVLLPHRFKIHRSARRANQIQARQRHLSSQRMEE